MPPMLKAQPPPPATLAFPPCPCGNPSVVLIGLYAGSPAYCRDHLALALEWVLALIELDQ